MVSEASLTKEMRKQVFRIERHIHLTKKAADLARADEAIHACASCGVVMIGLKNVRKLPPISKMRQDLRDFIDYHKGQLLQQYPVDNFVELANLSVIDGEWYPFIRDLGPRSLDEEIFACVRCQKALLIDDPKKREPPLFSIMSGFILGRTPKQLSLIEQYAIAMAVPISSMVKCVEGGGTENSRKLCGHVIKYLRSHRRWSTCRSPF